MAEVLWDEQSDEVAERANGDPTRVLLAGRPTITPAEAGAARVASNNELKKNLIGAFNLNAEERVLINVPQWENKSR
jgi:hypothetical protein